MWRNIGFILLAIIVVVAGVGFILPAKTHLAQSITINAPPQLVFQTLNNMKEFNAWSPWVKRDPGAAFKYSGPEAGEGASMTWESKKIGGGTMTIMTAMPAHIDVALEFAGHGTAKSWYDLVPDGSGTKLTWGFESQPYGLALWDRYFGAILVRPEVKKDYKSGLADLKTYIENKQGVPLSEAAPSPDSADASEPQVQVKGEIETVKASPVVLAPGDAAGSSIDAAIAAAYAKVDAFIAAQKLTQAGPAIAITRSYDETTSHWVFDAGVPVAAAPAKSPAALDGVTIGQTYSGRVVRFKYHGRSDGTEPTYRAIAAWLKAKKLEIAGASWEEYLDDEKTPKEDWDINIYYPVK